MPCCVRVCAGNSLECKANPSYSENARHANANNTLALLNLLLLRGRGGFASPPPPTRWNSSNVIKQFFQSLVGETANKLTRSASNKRAMSARTMANALNGEENGRGKGNEQSEYLTFDVLLAARSRFSLTFRRPLPRQCLHESRMISAKRHLKHLSAYFASSLSRPQSPVGCMFAHSARAGPASMQMTRHRIVPHCAIFANFLRHSAERCNRPLRAPHLFRDSLCDHSGARARSLIG